MRPAIPALFDNADRRLSSQSCGTRVEPPALFVVLDASEVLVALATPTSAGYILFPLSAVRVELPLCARAQASIGDVIVCTNLGGC